MNQVPQISQQMPNVSWESLENYSDDNQTLVFPGSTVDQSCENEDQVQPSSVKSSFHTRLATLNGIKSQKESYNINLNTQKKSLSNNRVLHTVSNTSDETRFPSARSNSNNECEALLMEARLLKEERERELLQAKRETERQRKEFEQLKLNLITETEKEKKKLQIEKRRLNLENQRLLSEVKGRNKKMDKEKDEILLLTTQVDELKVRENRLKSSLSRVTTQKDQLAEIIEELQSELHLANQIIKQFQI
ncbi:MAG: hypothetical protein O7C56_00195 [Rickettsia endosymbiont of Ixodes persulcatus]|nr:hypothetical protein [Rickettsia endosymbiont of Ixodes persulcatus]